MYCDKYLAASIFLTVACNMSLHFECACNCDQAWSKLVKENGLHNYAARSLDRAVRYGLDKKELFSLILKSGDRDDKLLVYGYMTLHAGEYGDDLFSLLENEDRLGDYSTIFSLPEFAFSFTAESTIQSLNVATRCLEEVDDYPAVLSALARSPGELSRKIITTDIYNHLGDKMRVGFGLKALEDWALRYGEH